MKSICLLMVVLCLQFSGYAQLKPSITCPAFEVDILNGKIGDMRPNSTIPEIKSHYPCFSSVQEESVSSPCGGVFYKDRDLTFYTGRDYVEIGEKFKGKINLPLMGAARNSLFKWLGNPKIKDTNWDAFEMAYGTLVLYYNKTSRVNKIQFSTLSSEGLQLCQ